MIGIPLGIGVVLLVLGLVYREDLEQAGLLRAFRVAFVLVPMAAMGLLFAVLVYRSERDLTSNGERHVSRAAASKRAILMTLLVVVFPLIPIFVIIFRSETWLDFTTVILLGVCVAALQLVWPLVLVALIDRDRSLEEKLRARILPLAKAAAVRVEHVVVAMTDDDDEEEEEQDAPGAFVCGLGRSRRIVIENRLVELLEPAELDAVVAHEFAHASEHHIAKKIAVLLTLAMGLGALDWMQGEETLGGVLLFGASFILCVLLKLAFDRRFEVTADRRAAEWVGARNLRNALVRLATCERPSRRPPWLATHPPLEERIRQLTREMSGCREIGQGF